MINFILMILFSYLMGSIPTAIIYGRLTRKIDIREHGSGNAGATNVFRVLGWKAGLLVMLIDMAKGLVATTLIYRLAIGSIGFELELLKIIAGLSAVFGHIWTVFAGFKGGKGVGTGAGMLFGLIPGAVFSGIIIFIITVGLSRYVSLGSILGSITVPVYLLIRKFALQQDISISILIFGICIPVLIIYTHRSNINRLLIGEETKINLKKKAE
jgi:glycerol-3-phosphate acyltransferase PlsY